MANEDVPYHSLAVKISWRSQAYWLEEWIFQFIFLAPNVFNGTTQRKKYLSYSNLGVMSIYLCYYIIPYLLS